MVILDIFIVTLIFLIATALGKKIFKWVGCNFHILPEEYMFSLGLGLFILSFFTFIIGVFGLLYRILFYIIFSFLAVLLFPQIKQILNKIKIFLINKKNTYKNSSKEVKFLLFVLFSVVISNFLFNYAPPTGEDGLLVYLAYPKIYIEQHRIAFNPNLDATQFFFQTIQMLYIVGMLLRGELAAKLITYFLGVSIALGVYYLTRQFIGKKYALLATVIFYTMPLTVGLSGVARVNFGQAFYTLLAVWAFLNWINNNYERKYIYLMALMSGIAFSTKYQGWTCIGALFILISYYQFFVRRTTFLVALKELFVFSFISLLIVMPWFVRNYLGTGNPIYPSALIKGLPFDRTSMLSWAAEAPSLRELFKSIISLPRDLPYGGLIKGSGPMFLAFIPFLLFIKKIKREIKILFYFSMLSIVLLTITVPYALRYWMYFLPVYVFLSVVTSYGIVRIKALQSKKINKFVSVSVMFALLVPNCLLSYYWGLKRLPLFLGLKSKNEYIKEEYPGISYDLVKYCNNNLPEDATILSLTYYSPFYYYYENKIFAAKPAELLLEEVSEILNLLEEKKIDFVIFDRKGYKPLADGSFVHKKKDFFRLNWFKEKEIFNHLQLLYYKEDIFYLYKVN